MLLRKGTLHLRTLVLCALLTRCACQVLDGPDTGNFIVLFKSPRAANLAANSTVYPHTGRVEAFKVQPAPNPEDVLWPVRVFGAAALLVCGLARMVYSIQSSLDIYQTYYVISSSERSGASCAACQCLLCISPAVVRCSLTLPLGLACACCAVLQSLWASPDDRRSVLSKVMFWYSILYLVPTGGAWVSAAACRVPGIVGPLLGCLWL